MKDMGFELTPNEYEQAKALALGETDRPASRLSTVRNGIITPLSGQYGKDVPEITMISADELDALEIPPMEWILEGALPHGVTIFGAPSKYFKSYLVLGACAAISQGKSYLGFKSNQCECLYFDLESTKRRPKERLNQILGADKDKPPGLHIVTGDSDICPLGKGFEEQLSSLLDAKPGIKLVAIDVFGKIRTSKGKMDQYEYDYRDISALKKIADQYEIAILLVSHTTKGMRDDPFDRITGSVGLVGAADCAWTITKENRAATEGVFHITGRDMETVGIHVDFNKSTFRWERIGTPEEIAYKQLCADYEKSNVIKTLFEVLKSTGRWEGTADELIKLSYYSGNHITFDSRTVGLELARFKDLLEVEGVTFNKSRSSKGMRYSFRRIEK